MKLKLEILAITLLIASFWSNAEAVKCYQCTSAYDAACGEDFMKEKIPAYECNLSIPPRWIANVLGNNRNASGCMKHVRMVNGEKNIERSCFYGNMTDQSIGCKTDPSILTPSVPVACHVCTGDLCNSAPTTMIVTSVGILTTICATIMKIF